MVVLQVTVDGLGATDHLYAIFLSSVVFSEHASVGVRVVTTDDYDSVEAELANHFHTLFELSHFFELRTTRTNHIETTRVAVFVDEGIGHFEVVVINQTSRTHKEAVEFRVGILLLQAIIETANHVVTTRSLATRKDDTDVDGSIFLLLVRGFEVYQGHTVGVGEEGFDFLLVVYTLGGCTFYDFHVTAKTCGEFGLVGSTSNLQCAFFHIDC